MSTAVTEIPQDSRVHYLNVSYGVKSWLLTVDHKRIALLYLGSITFMFLVGGVAAVLMRIHLIEPAGALVQPETYNKLFTMHGIIMVFFFLIPSIPPAGEFPGAADDRRPRSGVSETEPVELVHLHRRRVVHAGGAVISGGVDTGWTFYTPYSSQYSHTQVIPAAMGMFITGFSSILTGLNFIVTIHKMRAPGMTWFRLPLFIWSMYATSVIFHPGTPVLAITLLLVGVRARLFRSAFSIPRWAAIRCSSSTCSGSIQPSGGLHHDPAGMGVVSEMIACFSRKRIFGYTCRLFQPGIAVSAFLVWGHHMFVTGQSVYAGMVFSVLSFLVAIPSAIKVFNWTATLYKGSISSKRRCSTRWASSALFTIGGLTGLFLASLGMDVHLTTPISSSPTSTTSWWAAR
jgi:cytochrome c oxidase subunit 1